MRVPCVKWKKRFCDCYCNREVDNNRLKARCKRACIRYQAKCRGDNNCIKEWMDRWQETTFTIITVKIPIRVVKELDKIALLGYTVRSELIRRAINLYLAENKVVETRRLKIYY